MRRADYLALGASHRTAERIMLNGYAQGKANTPLAMDKMPAASRRARNHQRSEPSDPAGLQISPTLAVWR